MSQLLWKFRTGDEWSLHYRQERTVVGRVLRCLNVEASSRRNARLLFKCDTDETVQVILTDIVDTTQINNNRTEHSLGELQFPLLSMDRAGRILQNFYPQRVTWPLVFIQDFCELEEALPRERPLQVPLKIGFGKAFATGTIATVREQLDASTHLLSTCFSLSTGCRSRWFSTAPSEFSGSSNYVFNLGNGRLESGSAMAELRQTIWFTRYRERFTMVLQSGPI